jgi:YidC/Oxa1 family membrane protein insertase
MTEGSGHQKGRNLLHFLLAFILVIIATQLGVRLLFPEAFQRREEGGEALSLRAERPRLTLGNNVRFVLTNKTEELLVIRDRCPLPPLDVYREGEEEPLDAGVNVVPCTAVDPTPPGGKGVIDLSPWKYTLFSEPGKYRVALDREGAPAIEAKIKMRDPGFFTTLFRAFVSKPLYNVLFLIGAVLPGHSLALSIILLTILVKAILFLPSQHALEGQRKLQIIQPKIEEIKRRHAGDQKKMGEETMQLWREHRINPFQSCLPTLIQIPILIGLFFVVKDGSAVALNQHLLYGWYVGQAWEFSTTFLSFLDLTRPNWTYVPLMLAALQFWQMKLFFSAKKGTPFGGQSGRVEARKSFLERLDQKTMMLYLLPLMVAFFAASLPAAVSLYWGTSTLFAVGQQWMVNRRS